MTVKMLTSRWPPRRQAGKARQRRTPQKGVSSSPPQGVTDTGVSGGGRQARRRRGDGLEVTGDTECDGQRRRRAGESTRGSLCVTTKEPQNVMNNIKDSCRSNLQFISNLPDSDTATLPASRSLGAMHATPTQRPRRRRCCRHRCFYASPRIAEKNVLN